MKTNTDPTFRTYPPEIVKDRTGQWVEMTLCEELVEGRWEPFYAIRKNTGIEND